MQNITTELPIIYSILCLLIGVAYSYFLITTYFEGNRGCQNHGSSAFNSRIYTDFLFLEPFVVA